MSFSGVGKLAFQKDRHGKVESCNQGLAVQHLAVDGRSIHKHTVLYCTYHEPTPPVNRLRKLKGKLNSKQSSLAFKYEKKECVRLIPYSIQLILKIPFMTLKNL